MSVSNLAKFSIVGIKIDNDAASTDIHIAENGDPGRMIGEIILNNFVEGPNWSMNTLIAGTPDQGSPYYQIVLGFGPDLGKYFLMLRNDSPIDFEHLGAPPSFDLFVSDGVNSVTQTVHVTIDDV